MDIYKDIFSTLNDIKFLISKLDSNSKTIFIALIPASMAILGTIIGSFLTHYFNFKNQKNLHNFQLRQTTYGELMGIKFLTSQLYVSRFEALIYSDYYEEKWKQSGYIKDSIDYNEAVRWMHKCEDLTLEVAQNNNNLFKLVGTIQTLYDKTKELSEIINTIYKFKTPIINKKPNDLKPSDLDAWKTTAMSNLHDIINEQFTKPIETLLIYLEHKI